MLNRACNFGRVSYPGEPTNPMIDINEDILSKSLTYYSNYIKSKFIASYSIDCNVINCYVCDHSSVVSDTLVCMHECIVCMYMYLYVYKYIYVFSYVCMYVYVSVYACVCKVLCCSHHTLQ